MARSDILLSLVQSANRGDMVAFRKAVEILIAEERSKKHDVLADRLASALSNGGSNGFSIQSRGEARDLLFESQANRTFDDLFLQDEIKVICQQFIEEQHRSDLLRSHGLEPRNRILLAGSPGNGKTSLAEAIATHLMYPFFTIRYENLIGSYLGETASRLQKVFDHVKTRNCVLFFDEFDTIGKERGDTKETGEIKRVVSSLLLQMDRLPTYVVVITASNHPELLDRAVWRRFQIRLELTTPGLAQIESFIKTVSQRAKCNFNYNLKTLSSKLKGCSYSEVEEFCLEVVRRAVLQHKHDDAKSIVSESLRQWRLKFSA
ncbi:MAG: ATP-binding protein [candidate division Zixibacteria bacterium]|jgi:SpoVK/Ycf46/Vps4 family AAA+-type ATPase|nr:ATP-binding protein [candidate division Zixibacteria bacterium]